MHIHHQPIATAIRGVASASVVTTAAVLMAAVGDARKQVVDSTLSLSEIEGR